MRISARVSSHPSGHETSVQTGSVVQVLAVPPKTSGPGSAVNGGELLLLALATCFCNDLYREAAKRSLTVTAVEVECSGDFDGEGEAGRNFTYRATVTADAPAADIEALIRHTDQVAEVHKTLRNGVPITLRP
ncbi:OsmC family protein [Hymenobacter metallicola]|uniref:OsmC family peroxiredoxin n=1 Tax=Hymenobacter metallicola TaxID=2563114 RepID=A0A4Z0QGP9_9BACT|nr:OsmC family protein [Hymenobacter metallicola]TGE28211.1 OsmC family peroxiredoxin [Hymenobacter metallicola]